MSGRKVLIPAGIGVVDVDLQRIADAAAGADDHALELLMFPGGATGAALKRVAPLFNELRTPPTVGGAADPSFTNPRRLCADAGYFGGTVGRLRVLPCLLQVVAASTEPDAQRVTVTGLLAAALDTGTFGSNSSGSSRTDLVYATVAWATPTAGRRARRVKDTTTGVVTTGDVNVYAELEVSLTILPNATVSSLPGDGASSWNFPIAEVTVPNGYTSGGLLANVRQKWDRACLNPQMMRGVRAGVRTAFTNADAGLADADLVNGSRFADHRIVRTSFRHTAANALVTLDQGLDWRYREARVTLIRAATHTPGGIYGEFPPPDAITVGGTSVQFETGWTHTGAGDRGSNATAFWTSGGSPTCRLFASSSSNPGDPALGALVLEIDDAPDDGTHGGDHWVAIAECLGSNRES